MKSNEIDYTIHGDDLQVVAIALDPGETVIAEAGAMNWMDPGITFESVLGDGSAPGKGFFGKLMDAGKRALAGESLFLTHFTNETRETKEVSFAAPYPGKIIPVNLKEHGGTLLCQKDAFLCAAKGTHISIAFTKKLGTGLFGGEGFILQKLQGDGMAFLHAGGTVVIKQLENQSIYIDTGCIAGFSSGLNYEIERVRKLKSIFFGGEGLFLAKLSGTGTVFIQSLPFSRLAERVIRYAPQGGGKDKGEGSILGGFVDILGGDK